MKHINSNMVFIVFIFCLVTSCFLIFMTSKGVEEFVKQSESGIGVRDGYRWYFYAIPIIGLMWVIICSLCCYAFTREVQRVIKND